MYYYYPQPGDAPQHAKAQAVDAPEMQLAQAYVPAQKFRNLYTPEEALMYGTAFKELNQPYRGKKL